LHKPLAQIGTVCRTCRDGARIAVNADSAAGNCAPLDEISQFVGCLCSTAILQAICATAQLRAFRRIDAVNSNTRSVKLDGIPVDYGGAPDQILG
jgi:hypothetical protein